MASFLTSVFSRQSFRITQGARGLGSPFPSASSTIFHIRSKLHTLPGARAGVRAPSQRSSSTILFKLSGIAGVGIGLSSLIRPSINCDAPETAPSGPMPPQDYPPSPKSSVSLYELGFGTVTGICAGVFVKKGAKAMAWFLGGIFVLLQYLGSASMVRVDWGRMASKFENLFYTKDASGSTKPPTIVSLWNWLVNFLTADFQPRASFLAGFALGLRIG